MIDHLTLIPSVKSGSGSFVPLWKEDKKFWQSVEKLCSGNFKLLKIKLWAKEKQTLCDNYIEQELKREFLNEY